MTIYECKVFDKHGKLKRIISQEEATDSFWGNADFDYDIMDLEAPIVTAKTQQRNQNNKFHGKRIPSREITCVVCRKKLLVLTWNQIACSKECKDILDVKRRKNISIAKRVIVECRLCGKPFETPRVKRIYCQDPCTRNLWKKEQRKKGIKC